MHRDMRHEHNFGSTVKIFNSEVKANGQHNKYCNICNPLKSLYAAAAARTAPPQPIPALNDKPYLCPSTSDGNGHHLQLIGAPGMTGSL